MMNRSWKGLEKGRRPGLDEEDGLSRLLSLVLVAVYVIVSGFTLGPLSTLKIFAGLLVPLACVWFPDAMGEYTGQGLSRLTATSPPVLVWFFGWIILLLPVIVGAILWLQGVPMGDLLR